MGAVPGDGFPDPALPVDSGDPKVTKFPIGTLVYELEKGPDVGKEDKPVAEELEEEPNGGEENKLVGPVTSFP